jgi:hypothetical protein
MTVRTSPEPILVPDGIDALTDLNGRTAAGSRSEAPAVEGSSRHLT